jgi:hypothetical protein
MESAFPYRALSQLSLEEVGQLNPLYTEYQKCVHCDKYYLEAGNLGQLQCRLHPGVKTHDPQKGVDYYTCCEYRPHILKWQESQEARGCLAADHIAETEELCNEDEVQRHADLLQLCTATVPTGLFEYGVTPPLRDCVIYYLRSERSATEKERRRRILFVAPFGEGLSQTVVVGDAIREVSAEAESSPVLQRKVGEAQEGRQGRLSHLAKLESGWRSNPEADQSDVTRLAERKTTPYTLPFVVVQRMVASAVEDESKIGLY